MQSSTCGLLLLCSAASTALVPGGPSTIRRVKRAALPVTSSAAATEPTATGNPALDEICERATAAVTLSTGKGMESSGSGRPEWGTWCDTDLFKEARVALNNVSLETTTGEWPALWALVGGEAPSATLRIAGGQLTPGGAGGWDLLLRLFSAAGAPEERACNVKYEDGTLSLLKPLLGSMRISKFRTDGEVLCVPKELKGGSTGLGGKASDRAFLQLGGPPHEVVTARAQPAPPAPHTASRDHRSYSWAEMLQELLSRVPNASQNRVEPHQQRARPTCSISRSPRRRPS